MDRTRQTFTKGINRRASREDSTDPSQFYTLQNCRPFKRGNTGNIKRIEGYTKFNNNGVDYSNVLDILSFDDKYIIFYRDNNNDNQFHIDIFNTSGNVVFSDSYQGETTNYGELKQSDETIYITPHNKILYYYNETFILEDYISEIPQISIASLDFSNNATGFIEPTSSPDGEAGSTARGNIAIINNNTPLGKEDVFTLTFDGITTNEITVTYQDNEQDIAKKIFDALVDPFIDGPKITDNWWVGTYKNRLTGRGGGNIVYLTSKEKGEVYNNKTVQINGSEYNINPDDNPYYSLVQIDNTLSDAFNFLGSTSNNITVRASATAGGNTTINDFGPLYIRFNRPAFTVETDNIIDTDTKTTIANKIESAFNTNKQFQDKYVVNRNDDRVIISSKSGGKKENTTINLRFKNPTFQLATDIFAFDKEDLKDGEDSNDNITLEKETDYWYKVKYRFLDGHTSYSCQPEYVYTDQANSIRLTIQVPERDLDGSRPKIQIYRKKEFEDFFLIDEMDIDDVEDPDEDDDIVYIDNGKFKIEGDNLNNNIWFKSHQSSEIIDGRIVYGGLEYFTEKYNTPNLDLSLTDSPELQTLPQNTKARIFTRPKYRNGTSGYHTQVDEIDVNSDGKKLTVNQTSLASNSDKDIDELSFYVNYLEQSEDFGYEFNTVELANQNIPTIEDSSFYPQQTRLFFGFKYFEIFETKGVINVFGWDTQREQIKHAGFEFSQITDSGPIGGKFPRLISTSLMGIDFTYVRHGVKIDGAIDSAVYKLANYDAIKKAITTGNLFIRLNSSNVSGLSNEHPDKEIFEEKVKVLGIEDTSLSYPDLYAQTSEDNTLYGPRDSRLYLTLDSSKLDTIDNQNVNLYGLKRNYLEEDTAVNYDAGDLVSIGLPTKEDDFSGYNLSFEFLNFRKKEDASFNPYTGDGASLDGGKPITLEFNEKAYSYQNGWEYQVYQLTEIRNIDKDESLIYIGNKSNQIGSKTFDVTGYEFSENSEIKYAKLANYNIYENFVGEKDINIEKTNFPNQLVWTEPLITGNNFSGGRTVKAESFYNLTSEYGNLLTVKALNNTLYAFCERGVAIILIGETLAQQASGEVFVNSENFVGDSWWLQENFKDIKPKTIKRVDNSIIFSDGFDVFRLAGRQLKNITEGIIPIEPDNFFNGIIDDTNDEYILVDVLNNQSWVYNYFADVWYGPHTFIPKSGTSYRNQVLSVIGNDIMQMNTGDDFNGEPFNVVIENVANDTKESFYDKNYRKFYLNCRGTNDTTFSYGKTPDTPISNVYNDLPSKNDYRYVGIEGSQQNSKVIYWQIESGGLNFELKDISWSYSPNKRR